MTAQSFEVQATLAPCNDMDMAFVAIISIVNIRNFNELVCSKYVRCVCMGCARLFSSVLRGEGCVTRDWTDLYSEKLRNLHISPYVVRMLKTRRMWLAQNVGRTRVLKNVYRPKVLVEKPERERSLGSPLFRWENNAKIDLKEIG